MSDELDTLRAEVSRLSDELATERATHQQLQEQFAARTREAGEERARLTTLLTAARDAQKQSEERFEAARRERRVQDTRALFAALDREWTEAASAPYLEMSEAAFAAIAADLRAARPELPDHLRRELAINGADDKPVTLDVAAIFAARRAAAEL